MTTTSGQDATSKGGVPSGRILLVDSAGPYLESGAQSLRKEGYACDVAEGIQQGAELLRERIYDLLITDLALDAGRGVELIRRARECIHGLPILAVTRTPSLNTAIQCIELSVNGLLPKDVGEEEFLSKVRKISANSRHSRTLLRIQRRLQECAADLKHSRFPDANKGSDAESGSPWIPSSTLQALAGCLHELIDLEGETSPAKRITRTCELLQCPVWRAQRTALHKCILLLHETKRRFKSKELAEVRETLESLLETLG